MTALSNAELEKIGFGTPENPHISVHFDMFPYVYFGETAFRVGTTVDEKGGKVFGDMASAKEYAAKQFDVLMQAEVNRLTMFKNLIHNATPEKKMSKDGQRVW